MARGPSGRLVIEIDPYLKNSLHAALAADSTTLKEWFIGCASVYLKNRLQPNLPTLGHESYGCDLFVAEVPSTLETGSTLLKQDDQSTIVTRKS